ncbi:IS3 family transposase (plasmid) [Rhodococcus opacus]|uniref:IS3 family transposase n=8 Tax=Rhodococcus TaxID=1827 RepID=A0AAX3YUW4_RHOOP|nr:IS3 family transposase [Rhodococcus opacus]WKN59281.1 IS3 family transposase [Rhodococcus opacus]WKN61409.1 IS3 family transposase [Rhodococcus opacus]WKN61421.1 IS3 family transposase [Rhodococcus opacus]WKN61438.1 IS3 family transposase [Rhodococcus opacus]WLF52675.1 IS3 family transposase [Rhodococcus opacus]
MDPSHPRADGPQRRRAFRAADKLAHLTAYEQACESNSGGAYLRREGLYSSLISEWRKQRDAGVLDGKKPGDKIGKLTTEQAEIARLKRELERANKRLATTETALEIMGKAHSLLEQLRERGCGRAAQETLMRTHHELTDSGVTTRDATRLTGIIRSTAARDKARPAAPDSTAAAVTRTPENKLTDAERRTVLDVLDSDRFVDRAPAEVYAQLLDEGIYLCSVSTMYRILRENAQVTDRRRQARHPARACPELVATAPREVYSWDITKLPGPVKGTYFDAYVMIDIFSRYIVGAHVQTHESGLLAAEMMTETFAVHGIPNVVHADRGTSMTSKTVATLLADLEVTRSHSRPRVSNDNPYSESLFKTLKYGPAFPERFGSIRDAREFMDSFVHWYNHEHRHTGIGLHTPADVHFGLAAHKADERAAVLAAARLAHPERFGTTGTPKILDLPTDVWINQPVAESEAEPDADQPAA